MRSSLLHHTQPQRAFAPVERSTPRRRHLIAVRAVPGADGRNSSGASGEPPSSRPARLNTVREQITFFTVDGIVTIPGRELQVPQLPQLIQPMPTVEEQGLCIGATFALAATNGREFDRRINFLGFCQSLDVLNEVLAETVVLRGGEVLEQERRLKSGVHEQLRMTVCIPFLWGVPPEVESLSAAIAAAGGIVHQVQKEWGIYRPRFRQQQARHTRSSSVSGCGSSGADWDVLC